MIQSYRCGLTHNRVTDHCVLALSKNYNSSPLTANLAPSSLSYHLDIHHVFVRLIE